MRSCALIALASFGVLGLTVPAAAQNSVSVAKQSSPQLLAPTQTQSATPAAQETPPSPPPAPPAASAPAEVPIEKYTTMRPPIPMSAAQEQAAPEPQGAFASVDRLMDWISNYRKHKNPSRVPAAVHAMQDYGLFADEEKAWFCTGFIAGVLGSNPKDGPSLIPKMFPMPDKEQAVIIRAIVYSGRPDWRELLEKSRCRCGGR
jgi:hypothetical protein